MVISSSEDEANKLFGSCVFIFVVQMLLVLLVFLEYKLDDLPSVSFYVFLTRILCGMLLHMMLQGEVR